MGYEYKLVFASIVNTADAPIAQFNLKVNGKDERVDLSIVGLALTINNKTYNFLDYSFVYVEDKTIVLINVIPTDNKDLIANNYRWFLTGTLKIIDSQKTVRLEASGEHVPDSLLLNSEIQN